MFIAWFIEYRVLYGRFTGFSRVILTALDSGFIAASGSVELHCNNYESHHIFPMMALSGTAVASSDELQVA
jgi:hypothetical protein